MYRHPQLQYPKDEYQEYTMYNLDDLQDMFQEGAYVVSDCDHMRFPIGTTDLDKVTGPFVRLANVPETGTSPFGDGFLLLPQSERMKACELRDEDDRRKDPYSHPQDPRGQGGDWPLAFQRSF